MLVVSFSRATNAAFICLCLPAQFNNVPIKLTCLFTGLRPDGFTCPAVWVSYNSGLQVLNPYGRPQLVVEDLLTRAIHDDGAGIVLAASHLNRGDGAFRRGEDTSNPPELRDTARRVLASLGDVHDDHGNVKA